MTPTSTSGSLGGTAGGPDPSGDQLQPTLVLLDRVRDGDPDAVNRLLERHRTAIRRMIDLRMDRVIERRVDASDIVQDVMIEANRRLADYLANPVMPFRLWLRHMARDRLIDAHRRHRVAASRSLDREVPLVGPSDGEHSGVDALGQLADRELTPAAAATWHGLEHLSTAEAAEALGLSKPAAGMRYLRAMRRLRSLLDGLEPES